MGPESSTFARALAPVFALGALLLLLMPQPVARAFVATGSSLPVGQRWFRVLDNFADAQAHDNLVPDPNWPGSTGAELAIRKAAAEWGSTLYGSGEGDPTQPGDVGSGGANFDFLFAGSATSASAFGQTISAFPGTAGGVVSFTEIGPEGWSLKLVDGDLVWDDGPGSNDPGTLDIQSVVVRELGFVLGLGSSNVFGATMSPFILGTQMRSIEADDSAGVQFVYGAASASKPRITSASRQANSLQIEGLGFAPTGNEVRLSSFVDTGGVLTISAVSSSDGGTRISVQLPPNTASGDVQVASGPSGQATSNAFPLAAEPSAALFYCQASTSSAGCTAALSTSAPTALPHSGAGDYTLTASGVQGHKVGLFLVSGSGPAALPLGPGTLCIQPPTKRLGLQFSGGTGPASCDGALSIVVNSGVLYPLGPDAGPGERAWFQLLYRDPGVPSGLALSPAVELQFE